MKKMECLDFHNLCVAISVGSTCMLLSAVVHVLLQADLLCPRQVRARIGGHVFGLKNVRLGF